jgi:methanogenic corrinoid protein MtbC1
MSAKICEELIGHIQKPQMQLRNNSVKLAIVVLDDFHLLGKQIIYAVLKGVGYQIIDYGRMDVDELIKHVIEDNIEVLLISTLMLRSALRVKLVHEQLKWHQLKTRIIVGGAPFRFDTELWQEVGADATAADTRDLLPILDTMTKELKCLA